MVQEEYEMTREEFIIKYWKYYSSLEKQFIETTRFVSLDQRNFKCFSDKFAILLQAAGSELDSFFKAFCGFNLDDYKTIADYYTAVTQKWPDIINQEIDVIDAKIKIIPFQKWNAQQPKQSLVWWNAFDDIKHNRSEKVEQANLENVLNCLGALFMLEMKELSIICNGKEPDVPEPQTGLFELKNWTYRYFPLSEGFAVVDGKLCLATDGD